MGLNSIVVAKNEFEASQLRSQEILRLGDEGENGILSELNLVKTPLGQPLITSVRKINRVGARIEGNSTPDEVEKLVTIDSFLADDAKGVFDSNVRGRIEDISLPFKKMTPHYCPLSDIESKNMKIIMTEDVAEKISDHGVDTDLMGEEIDEIKSVPVTNGQIDLASATEEHRKEIESITRQMAICKARILLKHVDWDKLPLDLFIQKCAKEGDADCAKYLKLEERKIRHKMYIDTYSSQIISETLPKIYVPSHISLSDLKFPVYNPMIRSFELCGLPYYDLEKVANRNVSQEHIITAADLPEIEIEF